jgi:biofilm PGA synthesis protein PgaA
MRSTHKTSLRSRVAAARRWPACLAIIALGLFATGWKAEAGAAVPAEQEYRQALQLARQGRHDQALERLADLTQRYPDNKQYRYDYIAVLGWAEHDSEALQRAANLDLSDAPVYVLDALGKAARNQRDYPRATRFYQAALRQAPADIDGQTGLALTLADSGDAARARESMDKLAAAHPKDPAVLNTLAYVQQSQGLPFQSLDTYEKTLGIDPANKDARKGRIMIALRLGAPHLAAAMAEQDPDLLTRDERDAIERDKQAMTIRWSRLPATPETTPERETYKAIVNLRKDLEQLEKAGQGETLQARRVRYDLLVSLQDRDRNREAIELYEARLAHDNDTPAYVLAAAGQAYLAERRPEQARDLFLRALEKEPADSTTRLSLFYAYIESEDYDHALPLIDKLAADEPVWLGTPPNRRPNSARLRADIAAANGRAFANDLAGAEDRIAPLAEQAPLNSELHSARGYIYLWRGWPRRALGEFEIARNGLPANLPDARVGRGQALLALGAYPATEAALQEVQRTDPDNSAVRSFARDWQVHDMRELRLEVSRGESSGTQEGSKDLGFDGWLYGAPLKYHYRPFLHHHFEQAEFPEGTATYRRLGAGVEYQTRDILLTGELDRDAGDTVNAGVAVNGRWTPSDYWSFTAGADSKSDEIPLRGRLDEDVDGWSVNLGTDWRADEGRGAHVGLGMIDFSDDNRRTSANAVGTQRLITRPHYRMDGLLGIYASRNTRDDAPYFNPASDLAADLTLNNEWLLYRRYEYSFSHRLALTAGTYHQEDFGSDNTWALQYEQRWNPNDQFDLVYGVTRARHIYDGDAEYQTTLYLNLDWRF